MGEELVDFQTALQDLQMTEAELSNLVARGELRVIRSGGKPMFRPSDIQALKQERETDPTIIIPANAPQADPAQSGPITIDLPEDIGVDDSAATVVAKSPTETASQPPSEPQSDTGTEEIVFTNDLEILPIEADASQTSALTAAAAPAVDEEATVFEEDATATSVQDDDGIQVIDDDGEIIETTKSGRRKAVSARSAPSVSRRMSAAYDVQPGNPVMAVLLVIGTLVMLYAGSVVAVMVVHEYDVSYPLERDPNLRPGTVYPEEKHMKYVPGFLEGPYKGLWDNGEPGEENALDNPRDLDGAGSGEE